MPDETRSGGERTLKLVVEYDGSALCGWQRQANGPTVQQHLEEALSSLHKRESQVVGASRTDAGVHALGQVVGFTTRSSIPVDGYRKGLNALLPREVAVVDAVEVPAAFHPRFSALGKRYRYELWTRRDRHPLRERTSWHRPFPLDIEAMADAGRALIGEHDFTSFRASGCTAATAVREITEVNVLRPAPHVLTIEVRGNAFLRNMVRIVAGTLVDVGEGRLAADDVSRVLRSRDRREAGQTAPAQGLTLVEVFYAPDYRRRAAKSTAPD